MKSLKEKFGKFEMSKEQVKKVSGGNPDGEPLCLSSGGTELPPTYEDPCGGSGGGGIGGHCPPGISESWCHNRYTYPCGNNQVCFDPNGYYACISTCIACKKC